MPLARFTPSSSLFSAEASLTVAVTHGCTVTLQGMLQVPEFQAAVRQHHVHTAALLGNTQQVAMLLDVLPDNSIPAGHLVSLLRLNLGPTHHETLAVLLSRTTVDDVKYLLLSCTAQKTITAQRLVLVFNTPHVARYISTLPYDAFLRLLTRFLECRGGSVNDEDHALTEHSAFVALLNARQDNARIEQEDLDLLLEECDNQWSCAHLTDKYNANPAANNHRKLCRALWRNKVDMVRFCVNRLQEQIPLHVLMAAFEAGHEAAVTALLDEREGYRMLDDLPDITDDVVYASLSWSRNNRVERIVSAFRTLWRYGVQVAPSSLYMVWDLYREDMLPVLRYAASQPGFQVNAVMLRWVGECPELGELLRRPITLDSTEYASYVERDPVCPITLEPFQPNEAFYVCYNCKHRFSKAALEEWLQDSPTCAMCRNEANLSDYGFYTA